MSVSGRLDSETVEQIRRLGGDSLLAELISLYLENAPKRLDALETAMQAGELDRVAKAAHSIRSSSVSLGARDVADEAATVERMAESRTQDDLEARVAALGVAVRSLLESLTADLGGAAP